MNFRQIKLLNDLEAKIDEMSGEIERIIDLLGNVTAKVNRLENPPKRPRGRPPKVKMNG